MPRLVARAYLALLASTAAFAACSEDDASPPLADGNDAGDGSGANGGQTGSAGGETGEGDQPGGGSGQSGNAAGGGGQGGDGGEVAGSAGQGGTAAPGVGGAGSGGEPAPPGPPDLVTESGGPWPDSLTGICSNGARISECPQRDDAYFGQDGTYRLNVPSYTTSAGTLEDQVTHLVWQIAPATSTRSHADAVAYCESLELAGQADWRLPTRLEYVSLLDEGQGAGYALPAAIPIDATGNYWTASASGVTEDTFFVVADAIGAWNIAVGATGFLARCVRGAPLTGSLQVAAGVVTDSSTHLAWQTTELETTPRTWQQALGYCESLSHAGKDDWRLPSIKELATIVDEAATQAPVLAADFGPDAAAQYWSSSPAPPFGGEPVAFVLDTAFGISLGLNLAESRAARCVRTAD